MEAKLSVLLLKSYFSWQTSLFIIPYYHKDIIVTINGEEQQYKGTIVSTSCSGTTLSFVKHSYQCTKCYSLEHGKSSPLICKLYQSRHLKHPHSESDQGTKVGVVHKFYSESNIKSALQIQQKKESKLKKNWCQRWKNSCMTVGIKIQLTIHF